MSTDSDPKPDAAAVVAACLKGLAANAPLDEIGARLREVESQFDERPQDRARFLVARAIATHRAGFSGEALGILHEARRLIEAQPDRSYLPEILRQLGKVHGWRAEGREAALVLLHSVAEAAASNDVGAVALALIEAGRVQMEIGRPQDAVALFDRGLAYGGTMIAREEQQRAEINLVQVLVASGRIADASARLAGAATLLAGATSRLHFLAELERARIALASGDRSAARAALDRAAPLVPPNPETFERVELNHAEAELALAQHDAAGAEELLPGIIARCSEDELAGREVTARLMQAQALDDLKRTEEADGTLAAALRLARARGLSGRVDEVRSRIARRAGGVEGAWVPGQPPAGPAHEDSKRRFVRRRMLGSGGYGSVERAFDLELGVDVALKSSSLKDVYDPAMRNRLLDAARTEIAAASRIEHPGVARIFGLLLEGGNTALLIEEMVEGKTLRKVMENPVTPANALDLMARVAYALSAVHATGIVHRDVKPDNIVLRGGTSPVLVDFGIALVDSKREDAAKGGTPGYMPPEQAQGRLVDGRADLYALGVTAHELMLGKRPEPVSTSHIMGLLNPGTRARRQALVDAGLGPDVADLLAQLLAPHPYWRPRTAALVAEWFADLATTVARAR